MKTRNFLSLFKNLSTIKRDIYRVRKSGLLDSHYYRSYYPVVFDPALDYLLFSLLFDRDPGPDFDTNWYRREYLDGQNLNINPLMHYLKYGTNIINRTHNAQNGKHIEFIGINGSGKTTLYTKTNTYLKRLLGYRPGPEYLWTKMLSDCRYKAQLNNPAIFADSLNENWRYFMLAAFSSMDRHNFNNEAFSKSQMHYFQILCAFYQAVKTDHAKPCCMFDEGFASNLAPVIVSEDGTFLDSTSERLLLLMPKVDLLIHLQGDIHTCIRRMKSRKQGMPGIYSSLSENELFMFLSQQAEIQKNLATLLQNQGTQLVQIDSDQPIEGCFPTITNALELLIE